MTQTDPMPDSERNVLARAQALQILEGQAINPPGSVSYTSRGKVLVIGGEEAQWLAARIAPPMHAEVLLTHGAEEPGVPSVPLGGRRLELEGFLGAFTLRLGEPDSPGFQRLEADIIVDQSPTPLIRADIPPPGYWHAGTGPGDIDLVLEEIDGMVGQFEKPRYFRYDASICAHARSGQPGCRRCIDACPAEAIVSIGERVEVNPNLCQGGGSCATVCPTGAMQYAYPDNRDTNATVRSMLMTYRGAGGTDPVVLFASAEDASVLPDTPGNVLLIPVEELASVGHETWLSALAWGAGCVLLVDRGSVPPRSRAALQSQLRLCHTLLEATGVAPNALQMVDDTNLPAACEAVNDIPAAAFSAVTDKRRQATLALDHLASFAPQRADVVDLPAGAPYGTVHVDSERCTLCMACTSVCPASALSPGNDTPRLDFFETNCVQCGICVNACPEQALSLTPRFLLDPDARRGPAVLNEDPPFCCIECGKPFATRRVIENILGKLSGHSMFASERAKRRLRMCDDCRVVDAVQDPDAMQQGLSFAGKTTRHHEH